MDLRRERKEPGELVKVPFQILAEGNLIYIHFDLPHQFEVGAHRYHYWIWGIDDGGWHVHISTNSTTITLR